MVSTIDTIVVHFHAWFLMLLIQDVKASEKSGKHVHTYNLDISANLMYSTAAQDVVLRVFAQKCEELQ